MSDLLRFKRFSPVMNRLIIRSYKVAGLVALIGILVGLVSFLTLHAFYLVDNTWIRPMILTPTHERVVGANASLADAKQRRYQLVTRRNQVENEIEGLDRTIKAAEQFEEDFAETGAARLDGYEGLMARRERSAVMLERQSAADRREVLVHELASIDEGIVRYDHLIQQIESSAYLDAMDKRVVVAFVPYRNLQNAKRGTPIYACDLGLIFCSRVGEVKSALDGEVQNTHPLTGNSERGVMLEVELTDPEAAEESTLFLGGKPLWLL